MFRGLRLSDDDRLCADLIQRLMCHGNAAIDALGHRYGIDFARQFAAPWTASGHSPTTASSGSSARASR